MTNILFRYSKHFRNDIKLITINKNKKVINFTPLQHKLFNSSISHVDKKIKFSSRAKILKETENILIIETFRNMYEYIKHQTYLKENDMLDIINFVEENQVYNSDEIISLLKWCNHVIDCLPIEKVQLGQSLWLALSVCNFKMSVVHYNTLLKLYIDNEYTFSTAKLLADMYSKQIYPNTETYNLCIEYCCQKGNVTEALKLIEDMKIFHMYISKSVLNSLLTGYSQLGDILNMNKIINAMQQNELTLKAEIYAAISYAYAKLNDIDKVKETIENCYKKNMYFWNLCILNTIYIFAKNNHTKDIRSIYQYLIKKHEITNSELQVILKLIDINYSIAMEALAIINLNNNQTHFKNIITLLLKHLVNNRVVVEDIIKLFVYFKDESIFKKSLLVLLYYSLMKSNNLSLSLLKICKNYYLIKPHYFWPLLMRQAYRYNVQGILDILQIMIHDFNIEPCVDTIADYILPFIFGEIHNVRNVLMKYKVNSTIINNAYVLFLLKKNRTQDAAIYMNYFQDNYFYKILSFNLRSATVDTYDAMSFIYISSNLVENINPYESFTKINKLCNVKLVPMRKQLYDCTLDFPFTEMWLKKVISKSENTNIVN